MLGSPPTASCSPISCACFRRCRRESRAAAGSLQGHVSSADSVEASVVVSWALRIAGFFGAGVDFASGKCSECGKMGLGLPSVWRAEPFPPNQSQVLQATVVAEPTTQPTVLRLRDFSWQAVNSRWNLDLGPRTCPQTCKAT